MLYLGANNMETINNNISASGGAATEERPDAKTAVSEVSEIVPTPAPSEIPNTQTANAEALLKTADETAKPAERPKSEAFTAIAKSGELLFKAAKSVIWAFVYSILWLIAAFLRGWDRVVKFFKNNAEKIASPFIRYKKALKINQAEINSAKEKKGAIGAAGAAIKVGARLMFGKRGIIVTAANWILPILSCIFLFNVVSYANSQTYALKLTVNGDFIGYITNETVFTNAEHMAQKRINYSGSSTEIINFEPSYEIDTIGTASTLTVYQIADKILELVSDDIEQGYGLYIGDEYFGTLVEHSKVDAALEDLLDQFREGSEKETVKFEKDITFVLGQYMKDSFIDEDDMIATLTTKKQIASYYTVEDGDSPARIVTKTGMSYDELAALNDGFNEKTPVYTGERIYITQDVPFLSIMITREEHYEEVIDFETEYNNDSTIITGYFIEKRKGENGTNAITANVSYVNGIEVNRTVLSTVTTKKPVTQIMLVGTAPRPANAGPATTVPEGQFYWPVGGYNGGLISQATYGHGGGYNRYGPHSGVDIAAAVGTPVYAAASGTIIAFKNNGNWNDGYGNYVKIRHDNGIVTIYEHLSAVDPSVYVNKRVTMGELIGLVGNTGNSFGAHLHFEVQINGVWVNALDYLPAHAKQPGVVIY